MEKLKIRRRTKPKRSKTTRSNGLQASHALRVAMYVAQVVRSQRKQLHVTQEEVAVLSECGAVFIYDLERGKPTIRLDKLARVLEVLGLDLKIEPRRVDLLKELK